MAIMSCWIAALEDERELLISIPCNSIILYLLRMKNNKSCKFVDSNFCWNKIYYILICKITVIQSLFRKLFQKATSEKPMHFIDNKKDSDLKNESLEVMMILYW